MLSLFLCLVAALVAFPAVVRGESRFVQPAPMGETGEYKHNPVYDVGDKMDVQWESDLDVMDIILWQDYPKAGTGSVYLKNLKAKTRSTSMIWSVSMSGFSSNVTEGEDAVFYFTLYKFGENKVVTRSHYFNVSIDTPTTSTGALASATASTTVISSAATAATSSATEASETPSESSEPEAGSELSTGAVAGIAVGCTLGGILVLGGIGLFVWRRMRKGAAPGPEGGESPQPAAFQPEAAYSQIHETSQKDIHEAPPKQIYEAPSKPIPQEMPANEYARSPQGVYEAP